MDASVQHWDGRSWLRTPVPRPAQAREPSLVLDAIDCTAADNCVATGSMLRSVRLFQPVAARWDGRSWTTQWVDLAGTPTMTGLPLVSCLTATTCLAQMNSVNQLGFVELRWNGSTLSSSRTAPPTPGGTRWRDLSCSAGDCMVVGVTQVSPEQRPITARYRAR
jgi:hypothetical protein